MHTAREPLRQNLLGFLVYTREKSNYVYIESKFKLAAYSKYIHWGILLTVWQENSMHRHASSVLLSHCCKAVCLIPTRLLLNYGIGIPGTRFVQTIPLLWKINAYILRPVKIVLYHVGINVKGWFYYYFYWPKLEKLIPVDFTYPSSLLWYVQNVL